MVDEGEDISETLKREFVEEVAYNTENKIISEIFKNGTILYSGPTYGDPRTTDSAWIETLVKHYHIDENLYKKLKLSPQLSENSKVRWISCDHDELYGDHKSFVQLAKNNVYKISKDLCENNNQYEYVYDYEDENNPVNMYKFLVSVLMFFIMCLSYLSMLSILININDKGLNIYNVLIDIKNNLTSYFENNNNYCNETIIEYNYIMI